MSYCNRNYQKINDSYDYDEKTLSLVDLENNLDVINGNLTYHVIIKKSGGYILNQESDIKYIIEQIYYELLRKFNNRKVDIMIHLFDHNQNEYKYYVDFLNGKVEFRDLKEDKEN